MRRLALIGLLLASCASKPDAVQVIRDQVDTAARAARNRDVAGVMQFAAPEYSGEFGDAEGLRETIGLLLSPPKVDARLVNVDVVVNGDWAASDFSLALGTAGQGAVETGLRRVHVEWRRVGVKWLATTAHSREGGVSDLIP